MKVQKFTGDALQIDKQNKDLKAKLQALEGETKSENT